MIGLRRGLVGMLTLVLGLGVTAGVGVTPAGATAPGVTPDPTSSPFASATSFCTKDTAKHTGLKASAPGVTADSIKVSVIMAPLRPGDSALGFKFNLGDPNDMHKVFTDMLNQCGGINGRSVDVTLIQQEGGATDAATTLTNEQAACIKATEDNKPFLVISTTGLTAAPNASPTTTRPSSSTGWPPRRSTSRPPKAATSCSATPTRWGSTRRRCST